MDTISRTCFKWCLMPSSPNWAIYCLRQNGSWMYLNGTTFIPSFMNVSSRRQTHVKPQKPPYEKKNKMYSPSSLLTHLSSSSSSHLVITLNSEIDIALLHNLLLSLDPQPSLGLGLLHKNRLNFLEASQQFSFLQGRVSPHAQPPSRRTISPRGRVATHFSRKQNKN
jgi:hypothetical protein